MTDDDRRDEKQRPRHVGDRRRRVDGQRIDVADDRAGGDKGRGKTATTVAGVGVGAVAGHEGEKMIRAANPSLDDDAVAALRKATAGMMRPFFWNVWLEK